MWLPKKRENAIQTCCAFMAMKYGDLGEGSAPNMLITEIDDELRLQYSESIRNLIQITEVLKNQMNDNIQGALENIEDAEEIKKQSAECLELAKVFKKRTKRLKWTLWAKDKKYTIAGTTVVGAVGGVAGFMAGGPAGAAVFTGMTSVAAAQAIEASIGAAVFIGGFVGAKSAMKTWFWNQKFLVIFDKESASKVQRDSLP
mmetsp:Transcript_21082/g.29764  ORF Transcript_21082/g.29764 Transcript_21082/m.29764 type:complete len:201 (-) Transcript_21082:803-1405(-)